MKKKWTLFTFSRGDFKTLEHYLNEQAKKGWELEKTGILARWKRTERRDLTYCVDLAKPKQDREDRLDYVEFCREGGWELTAYTGQMYVFKSLAGADAVPVHTDPELERKQYNRYYIRNTILSVLILGLYFGLWLAVGSALGSDWGNALSELRGGWMTSWVVAGYLCALPFWGIWSVWKLIDFVRAIVKGRTGTIGESPRWVMWANNILAFAAGIGAVFFFAGDLLDLLFAEELNLTILILLLIWGGTLLYRALAMEKELFSRERRRHIVGGIAMLAVFALLIVGRVLMPYGSWSTSCFSTDKEKGAEVYGQTQALSLVHGEDLGIPFEPDRGETVYVTHELIPAGERWELQYLYGDEKTDGGFLGVGSYGVRAPSQWQAKEMAEALAEGTDLQRHAPWPEEGLVPVDIEWADEAWYGERRHEDGGIMTILVLRVDRQAIRLTYPIELLKAEHLVSIKAELEK